MSEATLRQALLEARDGRQRELDAALARAGGGSVLFLGANVPGADKHRPGLERLLEGALDALRASIGLEGLVSLQDPLGPFHIATSPAPPPEAKRAAMALETAHPSGRLLDLDVYGPGGTQADRASLGLPPRPCFLCGEPAGSCIRLHRHAAHELMAVVDALLHPFVPVLDPGILATQLHLGALQELNLTPKPGLVDRQDPGSHRDLTFETMQVSVDLLPAYFAELLRLSRERQAFGAFVQAGRDAETRMMAAVQSNAHKGYIFLSGIVLLAALDCGGQRHRLRSGIQALAGRFFSQAAPAGSHGEALRSLHGLGGIRTEILAGLPAIFDHGWPKYREALDAGWPPDHAAFYLMAILMQHLEDTTAIQRCGPEALPRLRQDGAHLQRLLEDRLPPAPYLTSLNTAYRLSNLTMGGVADCMALTFALEATAQWGYGFRTFVRAAAGNCET